MDWRIERRRRGVRQHTSEIRIETLPPEVQDWLDALAARVVQLEQAERRLAAIESQMDALGNVLIPKPERVA